MAIVKVDDNLNSKAIFHTSPRVQNFDHIATELHLIHIQPNFRYRYVILACVTDDHKPRLGCDGYSNGTLKTPIKSGWAIC